MIRTGLIVGLLFAIGLFVYPRIELKSEMKNSAAAACNKLSEEKSPYLLQHQNNPVCWYPWSEEAFKAAKEQNKPIFLSIGYSTCYWCHVMEKESFEREDVAAALNKHFISIKIDREERPDIDSIYMDAVQGMTGRGGWPMSVFLTPDRKPFWGGTYFPREQFLQILAQLNDAWIKEREKVTESASKISKYLEKQGVLGVSYHLGSESFRSALATYTSNFDRTYAGFGQAPKFPPSAQLSLLLRINRRSGDKKALDMSLETLKAMARGGMYDQVGGGFHRYSTDEKWLVPHFEKMLYDNALLAFTYLEAFQVTRESLYADVARETLDYVLRDMTSKEGAFYSAEDAGEVGLEGEFYVWKESELKTILSPEEFKEISILYGVSSKGNFEHGTNILHIDTKHSWKKRGTSVVGTAVKKLMAARAKRNRPHLDDKILTAWNGMMITAFSKGFQVLSDKKYLEAAIASANFIRDKLYGDKTLLRRYRDGEARFPAYLDDYAFYIEGLIHLYESTFNIQWLNLAQELQAQQDKRFWDNDFYGYIYSDASDVLVKKKEFYDGAIPAGNSVALLNLTRLYALTLEDSYKIRAEKLISGASGHVQKYAAGYPRFLIGLDFLLDRTKEIAIIKPDKDADFDKSILEFAYKTFLPNKVLAVAPKVDQKDTNYPQIARGRPAIKSKTTIYVCEDSICNFPTNDIDKAKELISEYKKY